MSVRDVVVAGGGPAGLAFAIHAARQGLDVVLLDRQALPADKACGEGLMPQGLRALERLGVRAALSSADCAPFHRLRYLQEDGTGVEGALPGGGGLGVRRTALTRVLLEAARGAGVEVREREAVRSHARDPQGVTVRTDGEEVRARLLVAADGLHSKLRAAEGLDGRSSPLRRFGLRRHFRRAPWADAVEVYFAAGAEAYVTPCGAERVGVAFLWERGRIRERPSFDSLLARFPALRERLVGAPPDSRVLGAGPMWQSTHRLVADRFALLGDAAGYVDALTGEGLSLALTSAELLARGLPAALDQGASAASLHAYEAAARRAFVRYAWLTRGLLALARRPRARREALHLLARAPPLFEGLLRVALR